MNRLVWSMRAWRMTAGDVGSKMEVVWLQFGIVSLSGPLQWLPRRRPQQRGLLSLWTSTLAKRPLVGSKWSSSATSAQGNPLCMIHGVVPWSNITQDCRKLQTAVHWRAQVGWVCSMRATFLTHTFRVNGRPQGYKNATFHRYVSSHHGLFVPDGHF